MLEWQLEIDLSSVVSISVVDLRNRAIDNTFPYLIPGQVRFVVSTRRIRFLNSAPQDLRVAFA